MLNNKIRILNFDGSILQQKNLLSKYNPEITDLRDLGPLARLWMSKKTRRRVRERLAGKSGERVNFLGSGDFHNITALILSEIDRPFSLVVFDFHPDWDIFPPRFGCGSWVTEALRNKLLKKCILIGMGSDDISTGSLQSANLAALKDARLEIYPYHHAPSRVFLRGVPDNPSIKVRRSFLSSSIEWDELKGKSPEDFMLSVVKRLPTKDAYLSIDKDCLNKNGSITNWEEGEMGLSGLLSMVRVLKDNLNLAGVDVTGDYSPVNISNRFKAALSRLDHPKHIPAESLTSAAITQINEDTNIAILKTLGL